MSIEGLESVYMLSIYAGSQYKVTLDVMNISHSKGENYSNKVMQSFAETYVKGGFCKKIIEYIIVLIM